MVLDRLWYHTDRRGCFFSCTGPGQARQSFGNKWGASAAALGIYLYGWDNDALSVHT